MTYVIAGALFSLLRVAELFVGCQMSFLLFACSAGCSAVVQVLVLQVGVTLAAERLLPEDVLLACSNSLAFAMVATQACLHTSWVAAHVDCNKLTSVCTTSAE